MNPKKTSISLAILALFVFGLGKGPFFPSLNILRDMEWDPTLVPALWGQKLYAFFWALIALLGLWGWALSIKKSFLKGLEEDPANLLGSAAALILFSLYLWGLAINGILYWPLVALFPIAMILEGWKGRPRFSSGVFRKLSWPVVLSVVAILPWLFEYLSAPIAWDAVLDHFRYAREVSRLHGMPLLWTNHTGDMPKFAELIWAGFWSLGGEALSKLSSALAAFLMVWLLWLFAREWKGSGWVGFGIFVTCPFFLAVFSWGYVEGFLAFYEMLALYCFWKAMGDPKGRIWSHLTFLFLGAAFAIKYTAVLAIFPLALIWVYEKFIGKKNIKLDVLCFFFFVIPALPWLLKNILAFGNPFYPLASGLFGASVGYSQQMEGALWSDTGLPSGSGLSGLARTFWSVFFTSSNGVNALWTPLAFMGLPWLWRAGNKKLIVYLSWFAVLFFIGWATFCTGLRHAAPGTLVLVVLGALGWSEALKVKGKWPGSVFVLGCLLSFWLCLSAQWTGTAPYAQALGMEDPLRRLKRNYSFSMDTYDAYRGIEAHSDPWDKLMAFGVWQTYSLNRTAFVDFKWKKPIFLQWASQCRTAEQLARKLREEGVRYFLYQRWEVMAMSKVEKDFRLEGMSLSEYEKFWDHFMEPVFQGDNSLVFQVRQTPTFKPTVKGLLPGVREILRD